jgi:hypothetical protein
LLSEQRKKQEKEIKLTLYANIIGVRYVLVLISEKLDVAFVHVSAVN